MKFIRSKDTSGFSDNELILKYRETDDNVYVGKLFERYVHLVFGVCMKYLKDEDESKDASMQIFEKLLTDLKKHNVEQFKGWLYSVARNHCLMQLRAEQRQMEKDQELKKDIPVVMEMNHQLHLDGEEDKEAKLNHLEKAINSLNIEQKTCVELFYLKEKCYQEIVELTGYNMNQVKSHIQNGKRNLKIYLTEKNG